MHERLTRVTTHTGSYGLRALMWAQFLSALADNAMLLLCMALLAGQGLPAWWVPLLKLFFTLSFVLLAPWLGLLADRWPKPRVMQLAHGIKCLGCLLLLGGVSVPLAYGLIGLGAALYAPAKYGWVTEVVPPRDLVRANGWLEVGTVGAAIFGIALGGLMLSDSVRHGLSFLLPITGWPASDATWPMLSMLALYALPLALTQFMPHPPVDYPHQSLHWRTSLRLFVYDQRLLWRDHCARISLAVTTLFWGLGAVMQLLVLRWAQELLGVTLAQGAYLQGCTGLGVMVGAWFAGRWIGLHHAMRVLGLGVLLGLGMPALLWIDDTAWAVCALLAVGVLSGLFVVPMNAVLQHRGMQLLTAGRSIAAQGFNENASVLCQMGLYAVLVALDVSLAGLLWLFGATVALTMLGVMVSHCRALRRPMPS